MMKVAGKEVVELQRSKRARKVGSPKAGSKVATPGVFPIDVSPPVGAKEPLTPWVV